MPRGRLNTVQKWWSCLRIGLSKRWAGQGITVRPVLYDELSDSERDIVYEFWSTGQLKIRR